MIRIRNVSKLYSARQGDFAALTDITLDVDRGEVFGIIGRSGAGKSTLLRMINLLERPSSGEVFIDDRRVSLLDRTALRGLRQRLGFVFQNFNLLNSRSVAENVRLPLRVAGALSGQEQRQRVDEVLELVGIAEQRDKFPRQLSGGQQQRVGIARALANRPDVLLCDEATSALDPETTASILNLLLAINQRLALTLVLVTHSMHVIRTVADRVAVLDQGRLIESGSVLDVLLHPRHAVTRALLAESGFEVGESAGRDASARVIRLTYHGKPAAEPLLTQISRASGLDFSLLEGSAGRLKGTAYGRFTIQLPPASDAALARFLSICAAHDVHHHVLH